MFEGQAFELFLWGWMAVAAITAISLLFIHAPYGRHARPGWGPSLPARWGWVLMESPSPLIMLFCFVAGGMKSDPALWLFLSMWMVHYIHRSWIYPFRARMKGKTMPISIALMAVFFNLVNGTINGGYLFLSPVEYGSEWLADPRCLVGVGIFVVGMWINLQSDTILLSLRKGEDGGYSIPHGGLYRWVSCPNYLGEILEWIGFAVATWSLPGLAFAFWTAANLAPRARANHHWYHSQFSEYPRSRKALIPYLF